MEHNSCGQHDFMSFNGFQLGPVFTVEKSNKMTIQTLSIILLSAVSLYTS